MNIVKIKKKTPIWRDKGKDLVTHNQRKNCVIILKITITKEKKRVFCLLCNALTLNNCCIWQSLHTIHSAVNMWHYCTLFATSPKDIFMDVNIVQQNLLPILRTIEIACTKKKNVSIQFGKPIVTEILIKYLESGLSCWRYCDVHKSKK